MPDLALGLILGEGDANTAVGPIDPLPPPAVTGALKLENDQDFLITEDGTAYLAFEIGS